MLDILGHIIYNADAKGLNSHGGGLPATDIVDAGDSLWSALMGRTGIKTCRALSKNRV